MMMLMPITLDAITAYIRSRLSDNPTPAGVAAHFGINRFLLSRWFRARTGLSMRDYIAALKIEQGIGPLVAGQPIIQSQLEAGHASASTFAHRFRAHTGQTPRDYRRLAADYGRTLSEALKAPQPRILPYHGFDPALHAQPHALTIRLSGEGLSHLVFAGLFPEPIPRGTPVVGHALFHAREHEITHVPDGCYYLLGCEMRPSLNPMDFFRLDHCQRGIHPAPIRFPLEAPTTLTLHLRPLEPSDPPITVNMPKLLFDHFRQQTRVTQPKRRAE